MATAASRPVPPHGRARLIALGRATKPIREASGTARGMLWAGAAITLFFVVLAVFARFISPYGFTQYKSDGVRFPQLAHPSAAHWMGTTVQSNDVMARVIYGAQTELESRRARPRDVHSPSASRSACSPASSAARSTARSCCIMDALFAFPYLLIAIVIAFLLSNSSIGAGILTAAIAITAAYVPLYFRVVRNHVVSLREEAYVDAARALGATPCDDHPQVRLLQRRPERAPDRDSERGRRDSPARRARLSRLRDPAHAGRRVGLRHHRAPSPTPSSGIWWTGLFPGLAIVLLVTGLTLVGEGLNETLEPGAAPAALRPDRVRARARRGAVRVS